MPPTNDNSPTADIDPATVENVATSLLALGRLLAGPNGTESPNAILAVLAAEMLAAQSATIAQLQGEVERLGQVNDDLVASHNRQVADYYAASIRADAAEERADKAGKALRRLAITKHVRMSVNGTAPNGYSCKLCQADTYEHDPAALKHKDDCPLAALPESAPKEADRGDR